ncbi:DoxX family protein [Halobacteriales archaeon QS_8_69_26]|nr:MAG: DoxX family protein [Halobacteriales archaeon QS_8_69_26]
MNEEPDPGSHDGVSGRIDRAAAALGRVAPADDVLRVGLGVVILAAGLHKLVAPDDWGVYLAPLFADRWPVSVEWTMVAFGVSELPFGLALIAGYYTTLAAAVVAVSMLGTLVDLGILWVQTGAGAAVAVRDLSVFVLAVGVTVRSATAE